ncbi:MAG: hypothetical protein Q8L86_04785 [Vicinamibacterales bacterium]|nr:hypothetical protein [Vicinamibacterales bacterium]
MVLVAGLATLAAWVERWWFPRAWHEVEAVASVFYRGDAVAFQAFARALADGRVFDNGIPFHPPGWPLLLAVLSTDGPLAAKTLTAFLGAVTVGASTVVAARLGGLGAASAVGVLGTFHFGHLVISATPNSEALYGCAIAFVLLLGLRWMDNGRTRPAEAGEGGWTKPGWAAATGGLAGLACLVRAEFLLGAVLLVCLAWWRGAGRREILAFVVTTALVLTPTTVWHWRSLTAFNEAHPLPFPGPLPRLAPVTSYGAFNFAMANHERADGEPNRDHPWLDACDDEMLERGLLDLDCPAAYGLYVSGYRAGLEWLVTHPADAAALWWRKAAMTAGFLAHGYGVDNLGAGVEGVRRRVDVLDPAGRGLIPVHVALLALGVFQVRRRQTALLLLGVPVVTLAASTLLFYGYVRLGLAYMPVFWVLQGLGAARVLAVVAPRAPAFRGALVALALALACLAGDAWRAGLSRQIVLDGPRGPAGAIVEDETLSLRHIR